MIMFALGVVLGGVLGTFSTCVIVLLAWHFGWRFGEDDAEEAALEYSKP